jgi:hypothetical protein
MNPGNAPLVERLADFKIDRERIAAVTTKYWRTDGVRLTVRFLDNPERALRDKILDHMNAWGTRANVKFTETLAEAAQVRVARQGGADGGYWSYVGTDILGIPDQSAPTMNLEAFTLATPDSEFHRVVRHETGHTLGFPHEHMRQEMVDRIDRAKAIAYYGETQGWSEAEVEAQVLTPLEESSLIGTPHTDQSSIMCYQIPGALTKDGKPILGGTDIDAIDYDFAAKLYPKQISGAPPAAASDEPASVADGRGGLLYFAPGTDPRYVAEVIAALRNR